MFNVTIDPKNCLISIDSVPIAFNKDGVLAKSAGKFFAPPIISEEGQMQYRLQKKANISGNSADVIVETADGRLHSVTFLFDFIEFFQFSILESKVLKKLEKSLGVKFISEHPSTAVSHFCDSGTARFFYDAKQGDLSLEITLQPTSDELN